MKREYKEVTASVLGGLKSVETLHSEKGASNNMPSLITEVDLKPLENRVLIDWCAFTLKELNPQKVLRMIGFNKLDFAESKCGGMGYKKSLRAGNIVIFYDGSDEMGCHVSLTGQGCRQFEQMYESPKRWNLLFITLKKHNANITRIDIACDNIDGKLDIDRLEQEIKNKKIRSRFRSGNKIENFSLSPNDESRQGKTIYIGSPASRLRIRFYDKAAQMKQEGHWTRAEIQCRAERASEVVNHMLDGITAGEIAIGVLNNNFQPINFDDLNRTRCTIQNWWLEWIEITAKVELTTAKAIKQISQVIAHVERQYAPTFAMLRKYMGVAAFHEFIHDLVDNGKTRLKKQHEIIIACSTFPNQKLSVELPF